MAEKVDIKKQVVFFSQYKLGGVQNYYRALISSDAGRDVSKTWILTRDLDDPAALPPAPFGITKEIVFEYKGAHRTSFYHELSQLVPAGAGVVMTNFHFELGMLALYGNRKTIFHVCHDDFFLDVARNYAHIIDVFIAHNYYYFEKLNELFPRRKEDIYYLPYGITPLPWQRRSLLGQPLKVLFLARFDTKKGVYDLFNIEEHLKTSGVRVQWSLIGDGPEKTALAQKVNELHNFNISTIADSNELFKEIAKHDVFILPSYLDGLPVALLETMSAGLVPLISAFNEGIRKIVDPSTGFVVAVGDNKAFAEKLILLDSNRNLIDELGAAARQRVLAEYNINDKASAYYQLFDRYRELKKSSRRKYRMHIDGSLVSFLKYRLRMLVKSWRLAS